MMLYTLHECLRALIIGRRLEVLAFAFRLPPDLPLLSRSPPRLIAAAVLETGPGGKRGASQRIKPDLSQLYR